MTPALNEKRGVRTHSRESISEALSCIPADDRDMWIRMGMAVKSEMGDDGYSLWDEWSQSAANYDAKDAKAQWRSFSFKSGGITIGTLIHEAQSRGFKMNGHGAAIDAAELERLRRERAEMVKAEAAEAKNREAEAAKRAEEIFTGAVAADDSHPYLKKKGIKAPHGARLYRGSLTIGGIACDGALVVPVKNGNELHSLQFITEADDKKLFLPGGRVKGCYFGIGTPPQAGERFAVAEGIATGASVAEACGLSVVCAFNAYNLAEVAQALKVKYPHAQIVVCADDDAETPGNPGMTKAKAAATAVHGLLAVPDFGAGRKPGSTDFNDLLLASGADAVRQCISTACAIPSDAADDDLDPPPEGEAERPTVAIDAAAPLAMARLFLAARIPGGSIPDIAHWQGEFWRARGTYYELLPMDSLKATLYQWLDQQPDLNGKPIKPNKRLVEGVVDALKAAAHLSDVRNVPAWRDGGEDMPKEDDLIACRNGLLHLPTRTLLPATRRYFNFNALEFDYAQDAPQPVEWLSFLRDLWNEDVESIETLQEIFGLALTSDTRHQKAFLIVGPRRSGKGTIARVLTQLVGMGNITAPMLSSMGQQFGSETMIGKTLAIISDARISGRSDTAAIVENVLRITGEDTVSVPRKFKPDWTARLRVRFVILSNELPALLDQSGALAGRFIVLRLTSSFFGKEDLSLTQRLLGEMPGILLWALEGLDRLRARGYFRQPAASLEMVRQLEMLGSPIKAFFAECCIVSPGASVERDRLYGAWKDWAVQQGRDHAGTIATFGKGLASAFPEIRSGRPRDGVGNRHRRYEGVRLRDITDPDPDE